MVHKKVIAYSLVILCGFLFKPTLASNSEIDLGIRQWCNEAEKSLRKLHWEISACNDLQWKSWGKSVQGRELVYTDFGNKESGNVTLVLGTIHGDEVTPLYISLKLAHWLKNHQDLLQNTRVVIAPLINPDGFYASPRTRMNANGVDINRNFSTLDWEEKAVSQWHSRYRKDPRRNPGDKPRSEPETIFQEELIRQVRPQKILSVHSPLNFLDYDGPDRLALHRFPKEYVKRCLRLKATLKAVHNRFYPGSLGNYAGQERGIPTLTLELPSTNPRRAEMYWKKFVRGIWTMIDFSVPRYALTEQKNNNGG